MLSSKKIHDVNEVATLECLNEILIISHFGQQFFNAIKMLKFWYDSNYSTMHEKNEITSVKPFEFSSKPRRKIKNATRGLKNFMCKG